MEPNLKKINCLVHLDFKVQCTTLMGCDPSGSVVFISKLFTGLISNKDLTKQSGLLKFLEESL